VNAFASGDHLVIGICNGCQVLVNLGLVPALTKNGEREVALLANDSARYTVRWTDLVNESKSPWLRGVSSVMLPIAHGEGKFSMSASTLARMKKQKQIALRYVRGEICTFQSLPANPTGTVENIAAITNPTGKVLAIMPHPERAIFFTQLPHWTYLKEQLKRKGEPIPTEGPGLQIFKNAVSYFS
jgi:phosphoribosylformylglycinamidine (FGAM) synthase-like amidotransferase family enzyme